MTGVDQFLFDLEQLHFGLIKQQEHGRRTRGNLPAQFAADAAASPGHHHYSIAEDLPNILRGQMHRVPAQKVLDYTEDASTLPGASEQQVTVARLLPLQALEPGQYTLTMKVTDKGKNQTITPTATFTVK